MFKKIKNRKGFTLIELIVVIAILAVLAAIIIPTVASSIDRAENARDQANARSIYAALQVRVLSDSVDAETGTETASGVSCNYTVAGGAITVFTCTGTNQTFALDGNGELTVTD